MTHPKTMVAEELTGGSGGCPTIKLKYNASET